MIIKKYDMYHKKENSTYSLFSKTSTSNLYNITIFLLLRFGYFRNDGVLNYLNKHPNGIGFEEVNIDIDNQENLVYFSESWYGYNNKSTTPEIEVLLEAEDFIQLCKMGFLDYTVMTKDNFMHILLTWDAILNQLPPFALLYLDDKNWYDIKAFDSQIAMEQFVADHAKPQTTTNL